MDTSLHYLTMANQMLIQKRLLERVKASGLTLGQPKVLDYLKDHDGASQKEMLFSFTSDAAALPTSSTISLFQVHASMVEQGHAVVHTPQ